MKIIIKKYLEIMQEKYRELNENEKNIKRDYGKNRYNMSEIKKQKKDQKNYPAAKKSRFGDQ